MVKKRALKEYIIQLDHWLPSGEREISDETSVDAHSKKEALNTAIVDVFMDAYPGYDHDYFKEMTRITKICNLKYDRKIRDWKRGKCHYV